MLKKFLLIVCMFNQFLMAKDLSVVDQLRIVFLKNEIKQWIGFPYEYGKRAKLFFIGADFAIKRGKIDLAEKLFELGLDEID